LQKDLHHWQTISSYGLTFAVELIFVVTEMVASFEACFWPYGLASSLPFFVATGIHLADQLQVKPRPIL
jgi:hypothetical protein